MPVRYQIDRTLGLIRTRCTGAVTFAEVLGHFRELENEASLPARLDVLLDLTETRSIAESHQLSSVAREIADLQKRVEWGSCAVVVSRDIWFGMSRMFLAFADEQFAHANVFRDLDEAEDWLASLRAATA